MKRNSQSTLEQVASRDDVITSEDVRAVYCYMLGREPESEEVVDRHLKHASDLRSLRERFLQAPEFYKTNARSLLRYFAGSEARRACNAVEYDCSPKDLDRLFAHIKQVWSQLGEVEPHFSVFSVPSFKPANLAGNLQSFHQSGKGEVELLQAELDAHGLKSSGYRHCVELGCGVGRVTRFLSETSKRVTGLDISAPHLAIARESLDKEGITNVALKQVAEPATVSFPACDLFYSRIVLQHNPPPVMLFLIRKFLSALEPGGVAVFQVPTSIDGYSFKIEEYLTRMDKLDNQELHALPKKAIFATLAEAGCDVLNDYRDNSLPNIAHVSTRFVVRKRQVGQSTPATVRS